MQTESQISVLNKLKTRYEQQTNSVAQPIIETSVSINSQTDYEMYYEKAKAVNQFVKGVEEYRKSVTKPLDELKKMTIQAEDEWLNPYRQFLTELKTACVSYVEDIKRKEHEANEKLRLEAKERLANGEGINEVLESMVDQHTTITIDKPKNIRVTKKARIKSGVNPWEVDWNLVVLTLFNSGKFEPESILVGLPKAMEMQGVVNIKGIEVYEQQTQILK